MRTRIAIATMLLGLAVTSGALAQQRGPQCQHAGRPYAPGQTVCLGGFMNECQANAAWVIRHDQPCGDAAQQTEPKACQVSANEVASPGARRCVRQHLMECSQGGWWVELGRCR